MIVPLRREPRSRPTVTSLTQTHTLNLGFAHYLTDWKKEVARCEHIIRQNPLSLYGPVPTRDQVFQNILREIKPLRIKLKKAKETLDLAHQEREAAYASLLGGLTGRRHKTDEAFEKALLNKERTLALLRTLYQKSMAQPKEEQGKAETAYRPTLEAAQNRLRHLRQLPGLHKDLDETTRKAFFRAQHTGQLEQALMILHTYALKTDQLQNGFFKPDKETATGQKPAPNQQTTQRLYVTPSPF